MTRPRPESRRMVLDRYDVITMQRALMLAIEVVSQQPPGEIQDDHLRRMRELLERFSS